MHFNAIKFLAKDSGFHRNKKINTLSELHVNVESKTRMENSYQFSAHTMYGLLSVLVCEQVYSAKRKPQCQEKLEFTGGNSISSSDGLVSNLQPGSHVWLPG